MNAIILILSFWIPVLTICILYFIYLRHKVKKNPLNTIVEIKPKTDSADYLFREIVNKLSEPVKIGDTVYYINELYNYTYLMCTYKKLDKTIAFINNKTGVITYIVNNPLETLKNLHIEIISRKI